MNNFNITFIKAFIPNNFRNKCLERQLFLEKFKVLIQQIILNIHRYAQILHILNFRPIKYKLKH